jgi:hypothetical protein
MPNGGTFFISYIFLLLPHYYITLQQPKDGVPRLFEAFLGSTKKGGGRPKLEPSSDPIEDLPA